MSTPPVAFSYVRFSTNEQRKGDSLRRQTKATADWCEHNGVRLDTSLTFHDLGKSAFLGEHRKNPDRHALAAFLRLVETGKIPRGSYLIIESLDRLTREHVRAGLMLCLGLIENGVSIVQLSPTELIYDEKSDEMSLMLMIVELSRGHRESKRKSDLSGPAWRRKKEGAREGHIVTERLPSWVTIEGGKLTLIPDRAEVVRLIFRLARSGYGTPRILATLNEDRVPAFGKSGKWTRGYLGLILRDRRAIGEYQPRKGKRRVPDGDPVPNYFPAVVSEEEFYAARAGAAERGRLRGRLVAQAVNVFAGLLKNAREGDSYYMSMRVERGGRYYVLLNRNSQEGRSPCFSFPYPVFERAILSRLVEIDPVEIVGHDQGDNEVNILSGELASVTASIAAIEADLDAHGESPVLFRRLRAKEDEQRDLTSRLAAARAKAAHPLAESWGECQTLVSVLDNAPDPADARLRLRSALRRVVSEIWLLVVPRGLTRLVAVQVYFDGDGHRDYLIYYQPPHYSFAGHREGRWWARSLKEELATGLDLRDPDHAAQLEAALSAIGPADMAGAG
jgi:DNA invertase Pin-like site-specific DNA recombinase